MQRHSRLSYLEFIRSDRAQHIRREVVPARRPRTIDNREYFDSPIRHAKPVRGAEFLAPIIASEIP